MKSTFSVRVSVSSNFQYLWWQIQVCVVMCIGMCVWHLKFLFGLSSVGLHKKGLGSWSRLKIFSVFCSFSLTPSVFFLLVWLNFASSALSFSDIIGILPKWWLLLVLVQESDMTLVPTSSYARRLASSFELCTLLFS